MTLAQIQARMQAILAELETLRAVENRSAEQETQIDALFTELNTLGERGTVLRAQAETEQRARQLIETPAGAVAARDTGTGANADADRNAHLSPMERFLASEAFTKYRANPHGKSDSGPVGSFFQTGRRSPIDLTSLPDDQPITASQVRALLYSGTATASMLRPQVLPTIYRGREQALTMRDVLVNAQTDANAITVLREDVFTNAAAEVAEATATSGGGFTAAAKPESAITFAEATYPIRTIAHWVPVTRNALDDLPFLRTYIEARLFVGLQRRENAQFLVGDGVAPNLTGLLNTSGVQLLNAAYWTANPVQNVGTDLENFDRILRAKTRVALVGEAEATFIVLNPADYETFMTLADANDRYYGAGPFAAGAIPTLWGLPVVQEANQPAGRALVGDGLMAAVVDRMDAQLFVADQHADFFTHNMFVFLAEERVGLPVFRPSAFTDVTLA